MTEKQSRGDKIAEFAGAIAISFDHHLPQFQRNNMMVLAAWWSVPLYIQGIKQHKWRRLNDLEWSAGAQKMATRLILHHKLLGDEGEMDIAIRDALEGLIVWNIRMWSAIFKGFPNRKDMHDQEQNFQKLYDAFSDPDMELKQSFKLYTSTDLGVDDDEPFDDISDFCEALSRLIDISARSQP